MQQSTLQNTNPNFARILHTVAFIVIVAAVGGRSVLPEIPFRASYQLPDVMTSQMDGGDFGPERAEYAGVLYGCGIMLAGLLWVLGCALSRSLKIRAGWMLGLIGVFAIWSFLSAIYASDKRAAVNFAFVQSTIMLAGWLIIQLCGADRRRICILLAILGALGAMLAAKGLWQQYVETPQRIEHFEMYRSEILQSRGIAPDSPSAVAYESRLKGAAPIGYIAMSNPFGSVLLLLGSIVLGLGIDRLIHARSHARATRGKRKKGEIHAPTFTAGLCILIAVAVLFVTVLTRSRGAIGSLIVVTIVALIVLKFRRMLARHWKKCLCAVIGLVLLGAGFIVVWGITHDSLPTKTMTFRWYYWTGGAEIIADKPIWGTGGGNFGTAYLQHRRPAAEEATKTPHNFVIHAFSQYGIPGGLAYLGVLVGMLVCVCRPARDEEYCCLENEKSSLKPLVVVAGMALAVFGAFAMFTNARDDMRLLVLELIDNGLVFVLAGVLMFWSGGGLSLVASRPGRVARVIIACGLVGFVLHNGVTFSLWMGGPAMLFWVAAGTIAAMAGCKAGQLDLGKLRWLGVAILLILTVGAFWKIYKPVSSRQQALENLHHHARVKDYSSMISSARRSVQADGLDGYSASLAARLVSMGWPQNDIASREESLTLAKTAISRDPMNASHYKLAADALWGRNEKSPQWPGLASQSMEYFSKAVELDTQSMRMKIKMAKRLMVLGGEENENRAKLQLQQTLAINEALFSDSIYRLSADEIAEIRNLLSLS